MLTDFLYYKAQRFLVQSLRFLRYAGLFDMKYLTQILQRFLQKRNKILHCYSIFFSESIITRRMKKIMRKKKRIASVLIALALIVTAGLSFPGQSGAVRAEEDTDNITIVDASTQWQYRDDNQAPADGWKTSETVTETWKTAAGSFGAKNGVIADLGGGCTPKTLLNQYIEGTSNDIPVYYFRKTFDLEDPTIVQSVTGSLLYDDAVTVYINGVRIAGYDDGSFDENGYGGSNASAPKTGEINFTEIAALNLKGTGNVVSVELHNGRPSSSDVYLDFQSLTFGTAVPEKEVKYISLNIGSDETQRNITWMASSDKEAYVQVATKPEGWVEGNEFPADAVSYTATQTDSAVNGLKSCKATMTDLKENTTYLYRVGNDEKWSDTYSFTTQALGQDQEFSFLFAGDPQIGASGNSAADTTNWQNTMSRSLQAFPQTSFLLSAGDQVNSRDSDTEYEGFLSPDAMRLIPLATNVGNHDNGSERYTSYYNMPNVSDKGVTTGSGSGDYWFMYNGMLVMSINSNNTDTAVHRAFLQETLNNHQEATWTVVTFHHSTYSVANHYSDSDIQKRRTELSPVFSELGIDVVLMGHDHYYTRTYMMNGCNAVIPEGNDVTKGEKAPESVTNPAEGQVFYLTANSASGSKYYARNGQLASGWPEYVAVQEQSNRTTITNVTVTRNSFTVDTYYTDSDVLQKMDSFTIYRTEDPTIRVPQTETGKITIQDGKAFNSMTGVSAQDYEGNDITELVHVTVYNADTGEQVQYVDTFKTGNYRIVYDVTDTYGKTASAEQLVEVVKNTDENPGQNPDENPSENPDENPSENPGQISGTGSGNGQTDNNGKGNGLATAGTSQSSKATTVKTGDEAPIVLFGVIMLLAAGAAVVVLRRRSIR